MAIAVLRLAVPRVPDRPRDLTMRRVLGMSGGVTAVLDVFG